MTIAALPCPTLPRPHTPHPHPHSHCSLRRVEPELMSHDMERELLRQKWERENQDMLENQDTVHYSNVRYDGLCTLASDLSNLDPTHLC